MLDDFIATYGWAWIIALVAVFFAALTEGGGKNKKTTEDEDIAVEGANKRSAVLGVAAGLATTLAATFLFFHTLLTPLDSAEPSLRLIALGAVVFVSVVVGFIGQAIAVASEPFHNFCKVARLPLAVLALIVSGWAAGGTAMFFLSVLGL